MRRRFREDLGIYGLPGDVSPRDIRFDPAQRAFLDREADGRFRLRIWTEPGLQNAMVVVRSEDAVVGHSMELVAATGRFLFWELIASLDPGDEYSFAFRNSAGKAVYVVPAGIANAVERLDRWQLPDAIPFDIPRWAEGAVIYQIFPDRFANGDPLNDPPDCAPWEADPTSRGFQGGDLSGVVSHLDYLQGLGADVLYLNPVFLSPSNHRYDTIDYHQVDPRLGGNEALAALVEEIKRRGMRIILDASFNHCHPRFFAFQDLMARGPRSPYRDWFRVYDWPVRIKVRGPLRGWQREWLPVWAAQAGLELDYVDDGGPAVEPTYESWHGVATMPRVNLAHPEARAYMLEVAARWLSEPGIDGWRMDVARYVDPDFWPDFRMAARAARPDAYLIGEFFGDASPWLQGDQFDATMNYSFRDLCIQFLATGQVDGHEASDGLARLWAQYAWPVTLANQNLLGSHDTARFLTVAGEEVWRLHLATVLQLTFPGAPGLYYGDEVEMTGTADIGCRGTFDWSDDPTAHSTHRLISELTALRRKHPALVTGDWRPLPSSRQVLAFARRRGRRRIAICINRGRRASHPLPNGERVLWGPASILDANRIMLPGRSASLIVLA